MRKILATVSLAIGVSVAMVEPTNNANGKPASQIKHHA
jgi:hypothetical protein